jgi:hypothetical protein
MIPHCVQVHSWQRDSRNPILPTGRASFDLSRCMNPFVLRRGDEYWMYYAGGDTQGRHRICLATSPIDDLSTWRRLGPLLDLGERGAFDAAWCVLPCVHHIGGRWHLYYTGKRGENGRGLQDFTGIGLAVSNDLLHWRKFSTEPVLLGDGFPEWPDNRGIAGGGSILEILQPDSRVLYRMHYTLATGTPSDSLDVDQRKLSVIAHSHDGIDWFDKRIVLSPRTQVDYENAGVIALNVWKAKAGYRSIYAAIGSRFGAYSICEAVSPDGLSWERGAPGENLSLPPTGSDWESQMTEYPNVIEENGKLRLFYSGNGYGKTGIGTALAEPLM